MESTKEGVTAALWSVFETALDFDFYMGALQDAAYELRKTPEWNEGWEEAFKALCQDNEDMESYEETLKLHTEEAKNA